MAVTRYWCKGHGQPLLDMIVENGVVVYEAPMIDYPFDPPFWNDWVHRRNITRCISAVWSGNMDLSHEDDINQIIYDFWGRGEEIWVGLHSEPEMESDWDWDEDW